MFLNANATLGVPYKLPAICVQNSHILVAPASGSTSNASCKPHFILCPAPSTHSTRPVLSASIFVAFGVHQRCDKVGCNFSTCDHIHLPPSSILQAVFAKKEGISAIAPPTRLSNGDFIKFFSMFSFFAFFFASSMFACLTSSACLSNSYCACAFFLIASSYHSILYPIDCVSEANSVIVLCGFALYAFSHHFLKS
jgi:hypothetical protein